MIFLKKTYIDTDLITFYIMTVHVKIKVKNYVQIEQDKSFIN